MKEITLSDINDQFQEFQDDLSVREKKLKLLPSFKDDDSIEKLLLLLKEEDHLNLLKEKSD